MELNQICFGLNINVESELLEANLKTHCSNFFLMC